MKTPLTFGEGSDREWYILDADENWIAEAVPDGPGDAEEVARRIVACVNALDGLDTATLELIVALGGSLPRRLEEMTNRERSEAEKQRAAHGRHQGRMSMEQAPKVEGTSSGTSALSAGFGAYPACKGTHCGCTDGRSHSAECKQEYADALNGVRGRCSVPMWMNGHPAGTCDCKAYGERPPSARFWNHASGEVQRLDGKYAGYVPGLACPAHGGPKAPNVK